MPAQKASRIQSLFVYFSSAPFQKFSFILQHPFSEKLVAFSLFQHGSCFLLVSVLLCVSACLPNTCFQNPSCCHLSFKSCFLLLAFLFFLHNMFGSTRGVQLDGVIFYNLVFSKVTRLTVLGASRFGLRPLFRGFHTDGRKTGALLSVGVRPKGAKIGSGFPTEKMRIQKNIKSIHCPL